MSRRRTDAANSPIALFPFLAVLICTMGVMIILLVVASKAAEDHQRGANADALARLREEQEQLEFEEQTAELKADVLLKSRTELLKRLEQSRLRRSHLENELRELESKFQALMAQVQRAKTPDATTSALTPEELQRLEQELVAAEAELETARQQAAAAQKSYAIVAQPTIHGTLRRPIYIECHSQGITLQPSGIDIPLKALAPPILPGNPLDASLLATREYWNKNGMSGDQGEPYPLLVVRPGGAATYGLARQAMQSWNNEFGYELIEEDMQIEYGQPDDGLTRVLQSAIHNSATQYQALQQWTIQSERAQSQASGGPSGLAVSRDGGFELVGGDSSEAEAGNSGPTAEANRASLSSTRNAQPAARGPITEAAAASTAQTMPNSSIGDAGAADVAPLSAMRGSNWALASQNQGTTAYRRPIVVYCEATALTIDDAADPRSRTRVSWSDDINGVDQFVHAIWKVIESWGIAERNGYWRPELRFVVMPGGEPLFEKMRRLMHDSGFDVRGENDR